jgi:hypothetical protein
LSGTGISRMVRHQRSRSAQFSVVKDRVT